MRPEYILILGRAFNRGGLDQRRDRQAQISVRRCRVRDRRSHSCPRIILALRVIHCQDGTRGWRVKHHVQPTQ